MDAQSTKPEPRSSSVAVIMATFNRAHLIPESIDSILDQTRPPDEFFLVNDGSTDDTATIAERYCGKIKYLEKSNGGKASALNLVLPRVESTYIWIFDDDDVALPDALEAHLKFLSEHPKCDFSYSTNYVFSGDFSASALPQYKLKTFPAWSDTDYFRWIMESPFLPTLMQGMLIPTRCYHAVGEFDERLFRGQDCDMVLRIARCFRAGFVGRPTFAERLHDGRRGPSFASHAEADRYRIWQEYKRQIFKKLRASLSLDEYLPKSSWSPTEDHILSPPDTRRALLQRAVVMATHGLYREAADDFRDYVNQLGAAASGLSEEERHQVSTLAHVRDSETVPLPKYYRHLGTLSRGGPGLFKTAMRGLYWSIVREIRRHRFLFALHLLRLAANLTYGYAGMPVIGRRCAREFL